MRRLVPLLAAAAAFPLAAQTVPTPASADAVELAYASHPRQRIDFTRAARPGAPLVVFLHGGGWSRGDKSMATHMAAHFHRRGYAFAAVNYRLVPDADPVAQAGDAAAAIAHLAANADRLGLDPERIIVIGHSAGAHLAALIGTDPAYLRHQRLPMTAIDGVVLLDGAGYDVPAQMRRGGPFLRRLYGNAFGDDPGFQRRVSPTLHAGAPNAARFLILHIASRPDDSGAQSRQLAEALRAAGTAAELVEVDGSHADIFRRFGQQGHVATERTDAFARQLFGR
ncbi:MAG TPA: alpha/beta hydrolase [Allosphingosinicella sp.]|nr:alpha/beta hydrolase [Allosphingosinicella sp.]